jgi:uncharacterized protein YbjQ (UPF0145 family)
MSDPAIIAIVIAAAVVIVLSVLGRLWRGARERASEARRRSALRQQRGFLEKQQAEVERLAGRIIATSSTASIAGFEIVRQIETVFTDGHPTPSKAVEHLKATAAEKGANAVINLSSARPPSGKCVAHGDAVLVRPVEERPAKKQTTDLPPLPPVPPSGPAPS